MKSIINRMFHTISDSRDKALEFYSIIDTALSQSPKSLIDIGFYLVNLYEANFFFKPVAQIIGNDENSVERVRSSLEGLTKIKLEEFN